LGKAVFIGRHDACTRTRWKITRRCYFSLVMVGLDSWQCVQQCLDNCLDNISKALSSKYGQGAMTPKCNVRTVESKLCPSMGRRPFPGTVVGRSASLDRLAVACFTYKFDATKYRYCRVNIGRRWYTVVLSCGVRDASVGSLTLPRFSTTHHHHPSSVVNHAKFCYPKSIQFLRLSVHMLS
jgi:hypothetical protein